MTLATLLLVNSSDLISQPPPGCPANATNSVTTTFFVKGCEFSAQICWKCKVTSSPLWFTVLDVHPVNPPCSPIVSNEEALDSISFQLKSYAWLYVFCGSDIPNCPTSNPYQFSERRYNCFKKYQPSGSPLPPVRFFKGDDEAYCQKDYSACMLSPGNMQLYNVSPWYQVGTPDCDDTEPPNPAPGYDSDCWLKKPDCD